MSISALITRGLNVSEASIIRAGLNSQAIPAFASTVVIGGFRGNTGTIIRRGFSPYVGVPEPPLVAKQYTDISALSDSGYDLWSLADPASQIGDIGETDIRIARTGYSVFPATDGSGYVDAGGDKTLQQFNTRVFHVQSLSFGASSTVFINDEAPILISNPGPITVSIGQQISFDFIAGGYVIDPDGDGLTVSIVSGSLPAGVTLSGSLVSGFPSASYSASVSFQFQDPAGATLVVPVSFAVLGEVTVPNVVGVPSAIAFATLTALGLVPRQAGQAYSNTIAAGSILTQSIAAGTQVVQGTQVPVFLSLGPTIQPGFRVTAVFPGEYASIYYQEGDVFDIATTAEYSDSTVNYQFNGNETAFGWMLQVPQSTPLFRAQAVQSPAPLFPVSFTNVRTVM